MESILISQLYGKRISSIFNNSKGIIQDTKQAKPPKQFIQSIIKFYLSSQTAVQQLSTYVNSSIQIQSQLISQPHSSYRQFQSQDNNSIQSFNRKKQLIRINYELLPEGMTLRQNRHIEGNRQNRIVVQVQCGFRSFQDNEDKDNQIDETQQFKRNQQNTMNAEEKLTKVISKQIVYDGPFIQSIADFVVKKQRQKLNHLISTHINDSQQKQPFRSIFSSMNLKSTLSCNTNINQRKKFNLYQQLKAFKENQFILQKQKLQQEQKQRQALQRQQKLKEQQEQEARRKAKQEKFRIQKLLQIQKKKQQWLNSNGKSINGRFYRKCPCCVNPKDQNDKSLEDNNNSLQKSKRAHDCRQKLFELSVKYRSPNNKPLHNHQKRNEEGQNNFIQKEKSHEKQLEKQEDAKTVLKTRLSRNRTLQKLLNHRLSKQSERINPHMQSNKKYELLMHNIQKSDENKKCQTNQNQGDSKIQCKNRLSHQNCQESQQNNNTSLQQIKVKRCYCCSQAQQLRGEPAVFKFLKTKKYKKPEYGSHSNSFYVNKSLKRNSSKLQNVNKAIDGKIYSKGKQFFGNQSHLVNCAQVDEEYIVSERKTLSQCDKEQFQYQFQRFNQLQQQQQSKYQHQNQTQTQNDCLDRQRNKKSQKEKSNEIYNHTQLSKINLVTHQNRSSFKRNISQGQEQQEDIGREINAHDRLKEGEVQTQLNSRNIVPHASKADQRFMSDDDNCQKPNDCQRSISNRQNINLNESNPIVTLQQSCQNHKPLLQQKQWTHLHIRNQKHNLHEKKDEKEGVELTQKASISRKIIQHEHTKQQQVTQGKIQTNENNSRSQPINLTTKKQNIQIKERLIKENNRSKEKPSIINSSKLKNQQNTSTSKFKNQLKQPSNMNEKSQLHSNNQMINKTNQSINPKPSSVQKVISKSISKSKPSLNQKNANSQANETRKLMNEKKQKSASKVQINSITGQFKNKQRQTIQPKVQEGIESKQQLTQKDQILQPKSRNQNIVSSQKPQLSKTNNTNDSNKNIYSNKKNMATRPNSNITEKNLMKPTNSTSKSKINPSNPKTSEKSSPNNQLKKVSASALKNGQSKTKPQSKQNVDSPLNNEGSEKLNIEQEKKEENDIQVGKQSSKDLLLVKNQQENDQSKNDLYHETIEKKDGIIEKNEAQNTQINDIDNAGQQNMNLTQHLTSDKIQTNPNQHAGIVPHQPDNFKDTVQNEHQTQQLSEQAKLPKMSQQINSDLKPYNAQNIGNQSQPMKLSQPLNLNQEKTSNLKSHLVAVLTEKQKQNQTNQEQSQNTAANLKENKIETPEKTINENCHVDNAKNQQISEFKCSEDLNNIENKLNASLHQNIELSSKQFDDFQEIHKSDDVEKLNQDDNLDKVKQNNDEGQNENHNEENQTNQEKQNQETLITQNNCKEEKCNIQTAKIQKISASEGPSQEIPLFDQNGKNYHQTALIQKTQKENLEEFVQQTQFSQKSNGIPANKISQNQVTPQQIIDKQSECLHANQHIEKPLDCRKEQLARTQESKQLLSKSENQQGQSEKLISGKKSISKLSQLVSQDANETYLLPVSVANQQGKIIDQSGIDIVDQPKIYTKRDCISTVQYQFQSIAQNTAQENVIQTSPQHKQMQELRLFNIQQPQNNQNIIQENQNLIQQDLQHEKSINLCFKSKQLKQSDQSLKPEAKNLDNHQTQIICQISQEKQDQNSQPLQASPTIVTSQQFSCLDKEQVQCQNIRNQQSQVPYHSLPSQVISQKKIGMKQSHLSNIEQLESNQQDAQIVHNQKQSIHESKQEQGQYAPVIVQVKSQQSSHVSQNQQFGLQQINVSQSKFAKIGSSQQLKIDPTLEQQGKVQQPSQIESQAVYKVSLQQNSNQAPKSYITESQGQNSELNKVFIAKELPESPKNSVELSKKPQMQKIMTQKKVDIASSQSVASNSCQNYLTHESKPQKQKQTRPIVHQLKPASNHQKLSQLRYNIQHSQSKQNQKVQVQALKAKQGFQNSKFYHEKTQCNKQSQTVEIRKSIQVQTEQLVLQPYSESSIPPITESQQTYQLNGVNNINTSRQVTAKPTTIIKTIVSKVPLNVAIHQSLSEFSHNNSVLSSKHQSFENNEIKQDSKKPISLKIQKNLKPKLLTPSKMMQAQHKSQQHSTEIKSQKPSLANVLNQLAQKKKKQLESVGKKKSQTPIISQSLPQAKPLQKTQNQKIAQPSSPAQSPFLKLQTLFNQNNLHEQQKIPQSVFEKLKPALNSTEQKNNLSLQSLFANLNNMGKITSHPAILNQVLRTSELSIQDEIIQLEQVSKEITGYVANSALKYAIKFVRKYFGQSFIQDKLISVQNNEICLFLNQEWQLFSFDNLQVFKDIFKKDKQSQISKYESAKPKHSEHLISHILSAQNMKQKCDVINYVQVLTGVNFKKIKSKDNQLSPEDQNKLAKKIKSFFIAKPTSSQQIYTEEKLLLKFDESHLGIIDGFETYKSASKSQHSKSLQKSTVSIRKQKKQHILSYTFLNDTIHHTELLASSIFLGYLTPNIKYQTLIATMNAVNTFELYFGKCMIVATDPDSRFILYKEMSKDKYEIVKEGKGFLKYSSPPQKSVYLMILEPLNKKKSTQQKNDQYTKLDTSRTKKICLRYYFKQLAEEGLLDRLIQCLYSGKGKCHDGGYENQKNLYLPVQKNQQHQSKRGLKSQVNDMQI